MCLLFWPQKEDCIMVKEAITVVVNGSQVCFDWN